VDEIFIFLEIELLSRICIQIGRLCTPSVQVLTNMSSSSDEQVEEEPQQRNRRGKGVKRSFDDALSR
jgi:hypothetical protein